jgi:hypothetical protein
VWKERQREIIRREDAVEKKEISHGITSTSCPKAQDENNKSPNKKEEGFGFKQYLLASY